MRATAAVRMRLRDASTRGAAIVIYSSDLDEVLSLASRVLVIFNGTVREVPNDRDTIGRAMLGLDVSGLVDRSQGDSELGTQLTNRPDAE